MIITVIERRHSHIIGILGPQRVLCHWIGLGEKLQETIDFPMKYGIFLYLFSLNQSIDSGKSMSMSIFFDILLEGGMPRLGLCLSSSTNSSESC